jgi:predicted DsbA family dithiol-disulfide isomerase
MTSTDVTANASGTAPVSLIVVSDFVCPWCYIGLTEVEKLQREYNVEVTWAPYLLDPTVPPEGRVVAPRERPGDALSPVEQRAADAGLNFTRGRTFRPNSHLALEAGVYAQETGFPGAGEFHRALYRAHFELLENIGDIDVLVRIGAECGMAAEPLREALATGRYREQVDEEIAMMRQLGVTAVPTFVFNQQYAIVGAEQYPTFQRVMEQLGVAPRTDAAD